MSAVPAIIGTIFSSVTGAVAAIGTTIATAATALFTAGGAIGGGGLLAGAAGSAAAAGTGGVLSNLMTGLGFSASSGFGSVLSSALSKGVTGALTGGVISKVTGGKFADGAKVGALGGIISGALGGIGGAKTGNTAVASPRLATINQTVAGGSTGGLGTAYSGGMNVSTAGQPMAIGAGGAGGPLNLGTTIKNLLGDGGLGQILSGAARGYSEAKTMEEQQRMLDQSMIDRENRAAASYEGAGDAIRSAFNGTNRVQGGQGEDMLTDQYNPQPQGSAAERYLAQARQKQQARRYRYDPDKKRIDYQ